MKTTRIRMLILIVIGMVMAGCGLNPRLSKPDSNNVSLVYGYIDMAQAPIGLTWATIKRVQPVTDEPYYNCWVVDGMFFRGDIPEGRYKFVQFGGNSFLLKARYTYNLPEDGKEVIDFNISRPGAYFIGSYKFKIVEAGFMKRNKFDLKPISSPGEQEILKKTYQYAQDDYWKRLIDARLKTLR